jgi:hypothetical protein
MLPVKKGSNATFSLLLPKVVQVVGLAKREV